MCTHTTPLIPNRPSTRMPIPKKKSRDYNRNTQTTLVPQFVPTSPMSYTPLSVTQTSVPYPHHYPVYIPREAPGIMVPLYKPPTHKLIAHCDRSGHQLSNLVTPCNAVRHQLTTNCIAHWMIPVLEKYTGQKIEDCQLYNHIKFTKPGTNPTPMEWDACAKTLGWALTEKEKMLTSTL